ncbi:MAG: hypothetical protein RIE58_05745 [Vicingaceae bacterium]
MQYKGFLFVLISLFGAYFLASTLSEVGKYSNSLDSKKIKGINFVAPVNEIGLEHLNSIDRIAANWISIIPYAYTPSGESRVIFYRKHPHWWGEGLEGAVTQIALAKKKGLKVMLKPQVWVIGDGWPGEFSCTNEADWKIWEKDFAHYILTYAGICDSLDVDLLCIGTEYRKAVIERPEFWKQLIDQVRTIYKGKLTYAANWDNYSNVSFWADLDYIGIDAYFPLSDLKTPSVQELKSAWSARMDELAAFCQHENKQIIFTEYGYRSCDYNARKPWMEKSMIQVNEVAQVNAYSAFYESVWAEEWMAGGFLWKWFADDQKAGGKEDANFTPQNKEAEAVVLRYYQ